MELKYTAGCSGKYWSHGQAHGVEPGDVVDFDDEDAAFHLAEPVWEEVKKPKKTKTEKDGE